MLGGFLVGGGLALVVVHTMGIQEKSTMLIAALAAGVVFAVIDVYKRQRLPCMLKFHASTFTTAQKKKHNPLHR